MSFENPTPLRVGASGSLDGWRCRVAGRVVMGAEIEGETYYWQEYHLVDGFSRRATLVFEETEDGPEWKLFKLFTPGRPLTVEEAKRLQVGDAVNLDGAEARITLVDQSRVFHIEGTAPEGTELGDVANYFNVDREASMLVVSWTGDEIEFYEGADIPAGRVASAFGFTVAPAAQHVGSFRGAELPPSNPVSKYIGLVLIGLIVIGVYSCFRGGSKVARYPDPPARKAAPAARIIVGARGLLAGTQAVVAQHAVVEVARVSGRQERHEYVVRTDSEQPALLINALNGNPAEWHHLGPLPAAEAPTNLDAYAAAALPPGGLVAVGSRAFRVVDLFQSKTLVSDGRAGVTPWLPLQYGFVARAGDDWLLARWTAAGIEFHRGRAVPEAQVLGAFTAAAKTGSPP